LRVDKHRLRKELKRKKEEKKGGGRGGNLWFARANWPILSPGEYRNPEIRISDTGFEKMELPFKILRRKGKRGKGRRGTPIDSQQSSGASY
jgi:hypothetical protein